ncbi:MAG: protein kinase, partial [Planctomycetota bacterium]
SPLAFESSTEPIDFTRSDAPTIPGVVIEGVLGEGGQGIVYRGRQSYLDRDVAVKVLGHRGRDFAARFRREAKILAGLSHPNIVACHQAGVTEDGDCFLVMELIDGPNLRHWLNRNGPLSLDDARRVCRDLAAALEHAHRAGIIHRDVKPENVLLAPTDRGGAFPFDVKLTDLGLARPQARTETNLDMHLTSKGMMLGTPQTMAPEQFEDPDSADHRTDIYGLGCIYYHMLTGQPAFRTATVEATIARKMSPDPPNVADLKAGVPRPVVDLVRRMLAREPGDRPQSYTELRRALDGLGRRGAGRRTKVWAWAGAGIVVAAVILAWTVFGGSRPRAIGPSQASEGDRIELGIEGGEGRLLVWRQARAEGEPAVDLGEPGSFVVPQAKGPYRLTFELVDAETDAVEDALTIAIDAEDDPPFVRLLAAQEADPGSEVVFDPTIHDPESAALELAWRQVSGAKVVLSQGEDRRATFRAPRHLRNADLEFELSVSDGKSTINRRAHVIVRPEGAFEGSRDLLPELLAGKTTADRGNWTSSEIEEGSVLCAAKDIGELGQDLPSGAWELRGRLHVMPDPDVRAGLRIEIADNLAATLAVSLADETNMTSRLSAIIEERRDGAWSPSSTLLLTTIGKIESDGIDEPAPIDFIWTVEPEGLLLRVGKKGTEEQSFREHRFPWTDLGTHYAPNRLTLWVQDGVACFCQARLSSR